MSHLCWIAFTLASALQGTPPAHPKTESSKSAAPKKAEHFKPFTGKVLGSKVRLRVKPDFDGHILRQLNKDELLLIVGEEASFYAVAPPKETKAYVFRSYILDDRVEANHVNVRLEPHPEAPIIAQLQAGDFVKGQVCPLNHKWLEIDPPKHTRFYVSKEYIESVGGAEWIAVVEKRNGEARELLHQAFALAEAECGKPFEEMTPQHALDKLQWILKNYSDCAEAAADAKEALRLLKETYLNKKIAYLEAKAELSAGAKQELLDKHRLENSELFTHTPKEADSELWTKQIQKKTKPARIWDTIEESLYLSWTAFHSGKKINDFYAEQKASAALLGGVIEPYTDAVKDSPGDFLLRRENGSLIYLYSTQIDLSRFIGKPVNIVASPRPNNHFAFPAYFVFSVEVKPQGE